MVAKVFVNYRREDTKGEALALRTILAAKLPRCDLFMDVDGGIQPGANYVRVLDERVSGADVFLCLIGSRWLDARDAAGNRRLNSADDFVRIEIASALKRDIPVIPILIDDTKMPGEQELPEQIRLMAYKQAMRLRHDRFNGDAEGIARAVQDRLKGTSAGGVSRWLLAASVLAALGLGTTAGPAGMKMAGMDAFVPSLSTGDTAVLRNRVAALEADNASLTSARSETLSVLQSRIKELESGNARVASLTSDLAKARADLKRLEDQGKPSAEAAARLRQLDSQHALQTKRIESVEAEKAAAEKARDEALAALQLRQKGTADATTKMRQLDLRVSTLTKRVETLDGEKSAAEKARDDAQAALQARQSEISVASTRIRQLDGQVGTLTKRVETLGAEKASADKARGEAEAALLARAKEVESLTSQLSTANAALAKVRQETASLEKREQKQAKVARPTNLDSEQVIAARGQWVKQHNIDYKSKEPSLFKHYFMVVYGSGHLGVGSIVVGRHWDQSLIPGWQVVHGHCVRCPNVYASLDSLTYLGPVWRPEYEGLGAEVLLNRGEKMLSELVTFRVSSPKTPSPEPAKRIRIE